MTHAEIEKLYLESTDYLIHILNYEDISVAFKLIKR